MEIYFITTSYSSQIYFIITSYMKYGWLWCRILDTDLMDISTQLRHGFNETVTVKHAGHTPPEGWVRAKKFCITFDTNFGRYLPRGTIIDGSWKCRMGAFCTIAKISGEMPKKGFKTGQNGVKFFLGQLVEQ